MIVEDNYFTNYLIVFLKKKMIIKIIMQIIIIIE